MRSSSCGSGEGEREEWRCLLCLLFEGLQYQRKGARGRPYQLQLVSKGSGGWWRIRVWLASIGSSRVDDSLVTLRCSLSVALSARWRFSPIIISCDSRYLIPHPLIRFCQTSPIYRLSDSSRLQPKALLPPSTANSSHRVIAVVSIMLLLRASLRRCLSTQPTDLTKFLSTTLSSPPPPRPSHFSKPTKTFPPSSFRPSPRKQALIDRNKGEKAIKCEYKRVCQHKLSTSFA